MSIKQWSLCIQQSQSIERSGMGFSFMEAFMDELNVYSRKMWVTTVIMKKRIGESNR